MNAKVVSALFYLQLTQLTWNGEPGDYYAHRSGVCNLLRLPAPLLLFAWSTGANEFELYLWDTFN